MAISFHRLAAMEIKRAYRWYVRRSEWAADRFRDAIDDAVKAIDDDPERWPKFRQRYRWVRTRKFPFYLYYEIVSADDIMIMAVAHGRRRPGYWLRRKRDEPNE